MRNVWTGGRRATKQQRLMPHIRTMLAVGSVVAMANASTAHADTTARHTVKYIVYSNVPAEANIYYRDTDPPTAADFSHDPYRYSPKVEANMVPGAPWEFEAALADPGLWAMVVATNASSPAKSGFRCELAVDGVITAVNEGPKGALCSLRQW